MAILFEGKKDLVDDVRLDRAEVIAAAAVDAAWGRRWCSRAMHHREYSICLTISVIPRDHPCIFLSTNESQDYPRYRRSWRNVSDDESFSLTILFASSSTDLHENAPGDYRFINGGEVRGESFFAAVVLRRNVGKDTTLPRHIHLTSHL